MLVLLVTLDCVRADHTAPSAGLAPTLAALGDEGTTFTQAFSQCQSTLPSHLSILTSNYPFQHGVYSNGVRPQLPEHALPRRLAERDWECRSLASVDFLAHLLGNEIGEADPRYPVDEDRSLRARLARKLHGRTSGAAATISKGIRWLSSRDRRRDTFLWLHLFDAHMLYQAPDEYLLRHVPHRRTRRPCRDQLRERGWFHTDFAEFDWEVPVEYFPARYAAAVRYQDACLANLVSYLRKDRRWDDLLMIITADHGECLLGDHGLYCMHKKLFDSTTHVPLWIRFPRGEHSGKRVDAIVQHVDVAATVAARVGFDEPLYMGKDLERVASGDDPGHACAFAGHVDNLVRAARDREWVWVEQVPGTENRWGFTLEEDGLYRRDGSPAPESTRDQARKLAAELRSAVSSRPDIAEAWREPERAHRAIAERLRALGYL
jgi:arylsulfatase